MLCDPWVSRKADSGSFVAGPSAQAVAPNISATMTTGRRLRLLLIIRFMVRSFTLVGPARSGQRRADVGCGSAVVEQGEIEEGVGVEHDASNVECRARPRRYVGREQNEDVVPRR